MYELLQKITDNVKSYPIDFGKTLYDCVLKYKPNRIIEFGPQYGFSTLCFASALSDIGVGTIKTYDLWEEKNEPDTFSVFNKSEFEKNINLFPEINYLIEYGTNNFFDWIDSPEHFDILYIDINNTGDKILKAYHSLKTYIDNGSVILFAGGNEVKDNHRLYKNLTPIHPLKDEIGYELIFDNGSASAIGMIKK
jgi:predicted O-methyltransferase YrrM